MECEQLKIIIELTKYQVLKTINYNAQKYHHTFNPDRRTFYIVQYGSEPPTCKKQAF